MLNLKISSFVNASESLYIECGSSVKFRADEKVTLWTDGTYLYVPGNVFAMPDPGVVRDAINAWLTSTPII